MGTAEKNERIEQFERLFRERGLPVTIQRRIVFEAVVDRTDHPTVDQVYDAVQRRLPGVSRTTVYRVLETLAEVGVIARACSPGAATRYDAIAHRHHHLVCQTCERLIDLDDAQLGARVKWPDVRAHKFQIRDFSIHFHGICAACLRKQGSSDRKPASKSKRGSKRVDKTTPRPTRRRKQT